MSRGPEKRHSPAVKPEHLGDKIKRFLESGVGETYEAISAALEKEGGKTYSTAAIKGVLETALAKSRGRSSSSTSSHSAPSPRHATHGTETLSAGEYSDILGEIDKNIKAFEGFAYRLSDASQTERMREQIMLHHDLAKETVRTLLSLKRGRPSNVDGLASEIEGLEAKLREQKEIINNVLTQFEDVLGDERLVKRGTIESPTKSGQDSENGETLGVQTDVKNKSSSKADKMWRLPYMTVPNEKYLREQGATDEDFKRHEITHLNKASRRLGRVNTSTLKEWEEGTLKQIKEREDVWDELIKNMSPQEIAKEEAKLKMLRKNLELTQEELNTRKKREKYPEARKKHLLEKLEKGGAFEPDYLPRERRTIDDEKGKEETPTTGISPDIRQIVEISEFNPDKTQPLPGGFGGVSQKTEDGQRPEFLDTIKLEAPLDLTLGDEKPSALQSKPEVDFPLDIKTPREKYDELNSERRRLAEYIRVDENEKKDVRTDDDTKYTEVLKRQMEEVEMEIKILIEENPELMDLLRNEAEDEDQDFLLRQELEARATAELNLGAATEIKALHHLLDQQSRTHAEKILSWVGKRATEGKEIFEKTGKWYNSVPLKYKLMLSAAIIGGAPLGVALAGAGLTAILSAALAGSSNIAGVMISRAILNTAGSYVALQGVINKSLEEGLFKKGKVKTRSERENIITRNPKTAAIILAGLIGGSGYIAGHLLHANEIATGNMAETPEAKKVLLEATAKNYPDIKSPEEQIAMEPFDTSENIKPESASAADELKPEKPTETKMGPGPDTSPEASAIAQTAESISFSDTIDHKGDSVWRSTREIFKKNPEAFGYNGKSDLNLWAERQVATLMQNNPEIAKLSLVHEGDIVKLEKFADGKLVISVDNASGLKMGTLPSELDSISKDSAIHLNVIDTTPTETPTEGGPPDGHPDLGADKNISNPLETAQVGGGSDYSSGEVMPTIEGPNGPRIPTLTQAEITTMASERVKNDLDKMFASSGFLGIFGGHSGIDSPAWKEFAPTNASEIIATDLKELGGESATYQNQFHKIHDYLRSLSLQTGEIPHSNETTAQFIKRATEAAAKKSVIV